jgi:hypothetical protein
VVNYKYKKEKNMLLTIGIILVILWLIGLIAFPVLGWFIHVLLVIAIIMILIRIIEGK